MTQEIRTKTNKYLHFLKLLLVDVSIIVPIYFVLVIAFWMLLGEGNGSDLYYKSAFLIIISMIFLTSSFPFFLKSSKEIKKEATSRNHIKLKNYKLISILNCVVYIIIFFSVLMFG